MIDTFQEITAAEKLEHDACSALNKAASAAGGKGALAAVVAVLMPGPEGPVFRVRQFGCLGEQVALELVEALQVNDREHDPRWM